MGKSISDYFAMWKSARLLSQRYSADIEKEHLADEQFVIQQHALLMMTKTPAANQEELRMKLSVAASEAGWEQKEAQRLPIDIRLKRQILQELDSLMEKES